MAETYNAADVIHGSSRVTYNGEADDTEGSGIPPRATANAPAPRASAATPAPRATASAPRPR